MDNESQIPGNLAWPTHQILGIKFFGGTSREAVEHITRTGGLLVAPAAPSMVNLCRDEEYRRALLVSEFAIADSGFMVLLWRFLTGERVPRISGLEHMKRLVEHESVTEPGAVLWVVPTERSRDKLLDFLSGERVRLARSGRRLAGQPEGSTESRPTSNGDPTGENQSVQQPSVAPSTRARVRSPDVYVAPKYGRPVEDETLLALVRQKRPRHIVIGVGGGTQDKVGLYLLEKLDYRPAIHCIGAALAFLTGDQVRIPGWADRSYLGWFLRIITQPRAVGLRYAGGIRLVPLLARYRDQLPPLH